MRILVTGGAGFIGANLARGALARGHEVVIVDDLSTGHRSNLDGLDVQFHRLSVLEPNLRTAMDGVDSVVHLGALGSVPRSITDPMASHAANATGTLALLECARAAEVSHVISASSSSVYGLNPALPKSEREWVRPMSPYAVTKLAAEQYTLAYQESFGMSTLAFRFFNVFGPWQRPGHVYAAVIPVFIDALRAGRHLPINGDGSNSRDFTYVGTVVEVLLAAAERRVTHPEPVNLAFGTNTTILQLAKILQELSGLPANLAFRSPRPGDLPHSQALNTSLVSLFPDVNPVNLEEGLRLTLEWFKSELA